MTPSKILSLFLSFCLILEQSVFAQTIDLSHYFARGFNQTIPQSDKFRPLHLRYISYDNQANDFKILLDKGDFFNRKTEKALESLSFQTLELEKTTQELIKYFFIGLALPNEKFWVNLRPDSPDNILDSDLEKTDIGRIFLEADLQLKKDTSSMTSPQTKEGKEYWDKLYKKAGELFGAENITIPTITRPWIVPDEVILRESPEGAYIYKATLKVMLEEDYLTSRGGFEPAPTYQQYAFNDPRLKELNEYSTQLIKETIIPKLTQAVNTSRRYAPLRQVYYSLILAQWFKEKYGNLGSPRASGIRAPVNKYINLIDSGNLANLTSSQPYDKQTYFQQYQKSFKDGEYNLQEPVYTPVGQSIRRHISGGIVFEGMISSSLMIKAENEDTEELSKNCIPFVASPILAGGGDIKITAGFYLQKNKKYSFRKSIRAGIIWSVLGMSIFGGNKLSLAKDDSLAKLFAPDSVVSELRGNKSQEKIIRDLHGVLGDKECPDAQTFLRLLAKRGINYLATIDENNKIVKLFIEARFLSDLKESEKFSEYEPFDFNKKLQEIADLAFTDPQEALRRLFAIHKDSEDYEDITIIELNRKYPKAVDELLKKEFEETVKLIFDKPGIGSTSGFIKALSDSERQNIAERILKYAMSDPNLVEIIFTESVISGHLKSELSTRSWIRQKLIENGGKEWFEKRETQYEEVYRQMKQEQRDDKKNPNGSSPLGGINLSQIAMRNEKTPFPENNVDPRQEVVISFNINLASEWQQIERLHRSGLRPSIDRLVKCALGMVSSPINFNQYLPRIRQLLAEVLRNSECDASILLSPDWLALLRAVETGRFINTFNPKN